MRTTLRFVAFVCITLIVAGVSHAKAWRSIVPLHSTREHVERLLGQPPPPPSDGTRYYTLNNLRSIYFLDEGEIYIVYAEEGISAAADCLATIPAGTVLMIQVTPKNELRLADLRIDERRFRRFDPSEPKGIGYEGFIDEEEGLVIRTFQGRVEQITYIATSRDRTRCPSYYENPESFVQIMVCGLGSS